MMLHKFSQDCMCSIPPSNKATLFAKKLWHIREVLFGKREN